MLKAAINEQELCAQVRNLSSRAQNVQHWRDFFCTPVAPEVLKALKNALVVEHKLSNSWAISIVQPHIRQATKPPRTEEASIREFLPRFFLVFTPLVRTLRMSAQKHWECRRLHFCVQKEINLTRIYEARDAKHIQKSS